MSLAGLALARRDTTLTTQVVCTCFVMQGELYNGHHGQGFSDSCVVRRCMLGCKMDLLLLTERLRPGPFHAWSWRDTAGNEAYGLQRVHGCALLPWRSNVCEARIPHDAHHGRDRFCIPQSKT